MNADVDGADACVCCAGALDAMRDASMRSAWAICPDMDRVVIVVRGSALCAATCPRVAGCGESAG